ncbi:MAG: hypothetical protein HKO62_02385 [Gammaproteobacteria bacterium]|nr:hypothetical protein [Gammaproteobacteria bacterium]NNL99570.1 hypothetical protein [Gammaproteobacteria bacterium]
MEPVAALEAVPDDEAAPPAGAPAADGELAPLLPELGMVADESELLLVSLQPDTSAAVTANAAVRSKRFDMSVSSSVNR